MLQGDRTKNVGVIDSEYVVHQGIQTLGGGPPVKKATKREELIKLRLYNIELGRFHELPLRFLYTLYNLNAQIRRQSTWELQTFKKRWNKAVEEDKAWVDPFRRSSRRRKESRQVQ
ncbi:hypothetical protein Pint_10705 [Pistacia integerrima]|uniref:Uncharacterized protein n=1 Tax=Pistacia integerrima TaxID=434235 RepID=A0ACC0XFW8_9ROSI|nr:hypothetical protein Pint_10705 [Pistacia integerrima]